MGPPPPSLYLSNFIFLFKSLYQFYSISLPYRSPLSMYWLHTLKNDPIPQLKANGVLLSLSQLWNTSTENYYVPLLICFSSVCLSFFSGFSSAFHPIYSLWLAIHIQCIYHRGGTIHSVQTNVRLVIIIGNLANAIFSNLKNLHNYLLFIYNQILWFCYYGFKLRSMTIAITISMFLNLKAATNFSNINFIHFQFFTISNIAK